MPQFADMKWLCVLAVIILPKGMVLSREVNKQILKRHAQILATAVDDVLVNVEHNKHAVSTAISRARQAWRANIARSQLMLQSETEMVDSEVIAKLESQHHRLLWEEVPKLLMPSFPPVDRSLREGQHPSGKGCSTATFQCSSVQKKKKKKKKNTAVKPVS
eukprot:NODE_18582_length_886_cov_1.712780.p1 GENE.NODE_18582_length_886_cov_1.712780~~NODE_18582_length_886_cov_1.712780.p1  ORF type:complete len:161 (+),score=34.45 NODE_18582_length_886_cov_1.712780:296-778(+)